MNGGFERQQRVRFAHCDPAGIIFFPQYCVMLNELVEDWFDRGLRIPYAGFIAERKLGLPTVRLECEFTAVSRMGDVLTQKLSVRRAGRSSLTLDIEFRCLDELRLQATQVLVCTSLQTHRSQPLPDDVRDAVDPFMATR